MEIPAPGARIVVRDAQWLVRRVERTQNNGHLLFCTGLSEIVRDKEARFLTSLEQSIEILDPAKTALALDNSPHFQRSILFLEGLLRATVPTDERLYCGHKAAMDSVPYQLDPAALALQQIRQRILIADAVGLGKTLECGILLAELVRRGRGRRILVVTVKSMMTQFQKELWGRFSIPLTRLDSQGIQRVQERIPEQHNPFYYYDKSIISIDTLKNNGLYRTFLENAWWDVIVIDEAHNVAERSAHGSLRSQLADLLASRSDSLILLSATPHDGSPRSFASLMNMLDPTAIANRDHYDRKDIKGIFIRRFKKDVKTQVDAAFREREIHEIRIPASEQEEEVFRVLTQATFPQLDAHRGTGHLFRTLLEKALFSSPAACLQTVRNSLRKLGAEAAQDVAHLQALQAALESLDAQAFSKYQRLLAILRDPTSPFFFTGREKNDRLIIFTERIETLKFLQEHLPRDLHLKTGQWAKLRGEDPDSEQQKVVDAFGKESSPLRLLLATDVASEGINLHYLCNKMLHFDVPWSLMAFQQRNGRIDRYGQTRTPHIGYLLTQSRNEEIRGDLRILELLIRKDNAVAANIGDPSAFLGVYDAEREEEIVSRAMENGSAEQLEADMDVCASDETNMELLLANIMNGNDETQTAQVRTAAMPTLYEDDFAFARDALHSLELDGILLREDERAMELRWNGQAPWCAELRYRFQYFPREIRQADCLRLSADKAVVQREIAACHKEENAWPQVQYLWELHPALRWLTDKVTASFRRNEAPALALATLPAGSAIFLVHGQIPNLKGQTVLERWFGCHFRHGSFSAILTLEESLSLAGLQADARLVNSGAALDLQALAGLLPEVVELAIGHMRGERERLLTHLQLRLNEQSQRLQALQTKHLEQLDMGTESPQAKARRARRERTTRRVFDEHQQWISSTLKVEDSPQIRIAAVFAASA